MFYSIWAVDVFQVGRAFLPVTTASLGEYNKLHMETRKGPCRGDNPMSARSSVLPVLAVLTLGSLAWGHDSQPRAAGTVTYFYPAPVVYVPVFPPPTVSYYVPVLVCPPTATAPWQPAQPSSRGQPLAQPSAAPPSAGPISSSSSMRPSLKPPATTTQQARFYDAYAASPRTTAPLPGDRARVYFWNLTNRDLVLQIDDGRPQILPAGRNTALVVNRQFTWKVTGYAPQKEKIAQGESALEIVIRR
jgi:hypothetical protein